LIYRTLEGMPAVKVVNSFNFDWLRYPVPGWRSDDGARAPSSPVSPRFFPALSLATFFARAPLSERLEQARPHWSTNQIDSFIGQIHNFLASLSIYSAYCVAVVFCRFGWVACQCLEHSRSSVFRAMSLVAFTPWKAFLRVELFSSYDIFFISKKFVLRVICYGFARQDKLL